MFRNNEYTATDVLKKVKSFVVLAIGIWTANKLHN